MALRIAHLSFSSSGGAGSVASRLAAAQRSTGHDATVISALSGSLRDQPLRFPLHTLAASIDHSIVRHPNFEAPISLLRDTLRASIDTTALDAAEVIHLHWPHGLVNLGELARIAGDKPVVWTLHDMNAFTGVCHYALGCDDFRQGCENCPAVRAPFRHAVSKHFQQKKTQLSQFSALRFVAPSTWLAKEAMASEMLSGHDVTVIPNPLPEGLPEPLEQAAAKRSLGIDEDATVFVVSASALSDPLKAVASAVSAFESAISEEDTAILLVLGRGTLRSSHPNIRVMGFVDQPTSHLMFSAADYLLVTSLAENQPLVISEAQAMGVSLIGRGVTGIPEHLDIDSAGRVFDTDSELPQIIREAASATKTPTARQRLAQAARKKFDHRVAVKAYDRVYRQK